MAQDATNIIKTAVVRKLYNDFRRQNAGLGSNPLFIQDRPIPGIEEPFIHVRVRGTREVSKTKVDSSLEYNIGLVVVVKSTPEESGERTRNDIMSEIVRLFDGPEAEPLDLSNDGFVNYIQNATVASRNQRNTNLGATYFTGVVNLDITAYYVGNEIAQPVANQSLTYAGFEFAPTNNRIEYWDSGTVTVSDSHGDSNGWTFESVSVAKASGRPDGTLLNETLYVNPEDLSLGLTSTFTFTRDGDTTTESDTDNIARIKSIRYGAIGGDTRPTFTDTNDTDTGLRSLSDWNEGERTLQYGVFDPNNRTININVSAGEWFYIVVDSSYNLTRVEESVQQQDILGDILDTPYVVGGYRIYITENARIYDTTYTLTLET